MQIERRRLLEAALLAAFASPMNPSFAQSAAGRQVVVIGAGIIGASLAYHLARAGAQVTVLEQSAPSSGATSNSFAWLNAMSKSPQPYYELNLLGILGWHRLQNELQGRLPVQWGGTVQWAKPGDNIEAIMDRLKRQQAWGYAVRTIEEEEMLALVPGLVPGAVALAYFGAMEGTVDPAHATQVLLREAQALGAKVEYPVAVIGFAKNGAQVVEVQTEQGKFQVTDVVLAAGLGCSKLAANLGCKVPLTSSEGLLAHTEPEASLLERIVLAPGATIKQNPEGGIVAGESFAATVGIKPTREFGEAVLKKASEFLPQLRSTKLSNVTLGHRVLPEDSFPIVGHLPGYANAYVAALHSGMTMAPIIGQLGAMELLNGIRSPLLDSFRPERFN